ncbi:MAG: hypothetical protein KY468_00325 [Armatimonadetes bacterium]|nr:hypothetical protein [Armatimonadota bacterium]
MAELHRYWIQFDPSGDDLPFYVRSGCGVTAYTLDDGLNLLRDGVFNGESLPPVLHVIEDVDIRTLDENHVRPNMGVCAWRGVWYPFIGLAE